jgi:AraC family transcriptional regulator, transcriptional activator of pobA
LVTEGSGMFHIDEYNFSLCPQKIFFTSPMQVCKWEFEEIPRGLVLLFEEEFLNTFFNDPEFVQRLCYFNATSRKPALLLTGADFIYFESVLKNIEKEIVALREKDNHILRALLYYALVWLNRLYLQSHSVPKPELVSGKYILEFRKLVNRHFQSQHPVSFYADKLKITAGHLNAIVKQHFGVSAKQFILNRIFLEAKKMLLYSSMSVSEIAWQLNFQGDSYFVRAFKRKTGYTPHFWKNTENP